MTRSIRFATCTLLLAAGCGLPDDERDAPRTEAQVTSSVDAGTRGLDAGAARPGVRGTVNGRYGSTPFSATFTVTEFVAREGAVYVLGRLVDVRGAVSGEVIEAMQALPLAAQVTFGPRVLPQAVVFVDGGVGDAGVGPFCDVLYMTLPPRNLDLRGTRVDLDRVELDVHADARTDQLLGNLLCAVSERLDPTSPQGGPSAANLERVVALLNQVLDNLRGAGDAG